jgi:hypothetical protein
VKKLVVGFGCCRVDIGDVIGETVTITALTQYHCVILGTVFQNSTGAYL